MKAVLLSIIVVLHPNLLFGQGTVNFANATSSYGSASADHLVRWAPSAQLFNSLLTPGALVSSNHNGANMTGFRAQLFYGSSTINSNDSLTAVTDAPATFRASTSANAGAWLGGTRTLLGFNPGDTVHLSIIVWDSSWSSDPIQGLNILTIAGSSGIFSYTIPPAGTPPSAYLMANQPPIWAGFPEPSTGALTALGAIVWLILRRWRQAF
jgi:hypothetical protein